MSITIRNFGPMREDGGMYFLQNFEPKKIGTKSVLSQNYTTFVRTSSSNLTNLGLITGFTDQFNNDNYFITDNGYVFKDMVSPSEERAITNASSNQADICRTAHGEIYYTTSRYVNKYDGSTWTDQWLDLGSAYDDADLYRQIVLFQDRYLIGNKDYLASVTDTSSTFNNQYKQLRTGYEFRAMAVNNKVAVAANKENKGAIFFWNGWSDGWNLDIYVENKVNTIKAYSHGWVFIAGSYLYFTNGNTIQILDKFPDEDGGQDLDIKPNGMIVVGNKIWIMKNYGGGSRRSLMGVWIYHLDTKGWTFVPNNKGDWRYTTSPSDRMGAIYFESSWDYIYAGYQNYNSVYFLEGYTSSTAQKGCAVFSLYNLGKGEKTSIERIEVDFAPNHFENDYYTTGECKMYLSVSDLKKPINAFGITNTASSNANEIQYDDTVFNYNHLAVKDEIVILEKSNVGERAYVSGLSGTGTSSAKATLDRNLSNNTENQIYFNVMPFKLAKGKNVYTEGETATFYPDFQGTQAMIKIWLDSSKFSIDITEIRIYD